jgi:hypothetical protein
MAESEGLIAVTQGELGGVGALGGLGGWGGDTDLKAPGEAFLEKLDRDF